MYKWMIAAAVALLAAPAVALADPAPTAADRARAANTCANVKAAIGARPFAELFAPNTPSARAAARNCARRETAFEHRNRESAEWKAQCEPLLEGRTTGEPAETPASEAPADRNAYGECVSELARERSAAERRETIAAARACKTERGLLGRAAFRAKYGGRANAFAKCVAAEKAD